MPELPEVQTVVDGVRPHLIGKKIVSVTFSGHRLRHAWQDDLVEHILNKPIIDVTRRAKYIAIKMDIDLVVHLGMSGKLVLKDNDYQAVKHDHVIMTLSDESRVVFNDPRRFGMFFWHTSLNQYLSHYGPEPLDESFNAGYLASVLKSKKQNIKVAIMDQRYVVGVGNIYACEALFRSRISPFKQCSDLTEDEYIRLVEEIKQVLLIAIKQGGTTLKDYRSANDELGYFQQRLYVYGRAGESCYECGEVIYTSKQTGRSTFYCKNCQTVDRC